MDIVIYHWKADYSSRAESIKRMQTFTMLEGSPYLLFNAEEKIYRTNLVGSKRLHRAIKQYANTDAGTTLTAQWIDPIWVTRKINVG